MVWLYTFDFKNDLLSFGFTMGIIILPIKEDQILLLQFFCVLYLVIFSIPNQVE